MVDIMRLALGFNNPHRDRGIRKMALIKVKDSFLSFDIQNLLHDSVLILSIFGVPRAT